MPRKFRKFLENKDLAPLFTEAANYIIQDVDKAASCCRNLAKQKKENALFFDLLAEASQPSLADLHKGWGGGSTFVPPDVSSAGDSRYNKLLQYYRNLREKHRELQVKHQDLNLQHQGLNQKHSLLSGSHQDLSNRFSADPNAVIDLLYHVKNQLDRMPQAQNTDYKGAVSSLIDAIRSSGQQPQKPTSQPGLPGLDLSKPSKPDPYWQLYYRLKEDEVIPKDDEQKGYNLIKSLIEKKIQPKASALLKAHKADNPDHATAMAVEELLNDEDMDRYFHILWKLFDYYPNLQKYQTSKPNIEDDDEGPDYLGDIS